MATGCASYSRNMKVGVTTTPMTVEDVTIDTDYFKSLEPK